jgi:hypothetical protein
MMCIIHNVQASTLMFVQLSGTSENWRRTSRSCITVVRRDKWKNLIPIRAGMTDKSISTGIKYWVCCIKESWLQDIKVTFKLQTCSACQNLTILQFWSKSDYPSWSYCPFFINFLNPALALLGQGLKKSPIGQKLDFANHSYLCKGLS